MSEQTNTVPSPQPSSEWAKMLIIPVAPDLRVRINSDTMEPIYHAGDTVDFSRPAQFMIEEDFELLVGEDILVTRDRDGQTCFMRLDRIEGRVAVLLPLNRAKYPDLTLKISIDDVLDVAIAIEREELGHG